MSQFLPPRSRCARRASFPRIELLVPAACILVLGCGEVTCPEPLTNVDGTCQKVDPMPLDEPDAGAEPDANVEAGVERCDGADNDGDHAIDESWPELGTACGNVVGECTAGEYVCAEDGLGVVCEGAVEPAEEVCDGKDNDCDGTPDNGPSEVCDGEDNDCDGLVDEGVLSVKSEVFGDHASVTGVADGFVVTRVIGNQVRIETYGTDGNRTGHHDDVDNPSAFTTFVASDSSQGRVLVALGKYEFYVIEARVDASLVPVVLETRELHADWRQGMTLGVYNPPYHPRVSAAPPRFLGYRDLITFALNPIDTDNLSGLAQEPTLVPELPMFAVFDAAGVFVAWEQLDNIRVGWLLDDGSLSLDIDVARGTTPAIAVGKDGPGVAYLEEGSLHLSELGGLSLQCLDGRFCDEVIDIGGSVAPPSGPTGLAFDRVGDTWFVLAGTALAVVSRGGGGAVIKQSVVLDALDEAPTSADLAVSGGTAAIVQATEDGDSALTFLGCF